MQRQSRSTSGHPSVNQNVPLCGGAPPVPNGPIAGRRCFAAVVAAAAWNVEPKVGLEPTTDGLRNRCSTTELLRPARGAILTGGRPRPGDGGRFGSPRSSTGAGLPRGDVRWVAPGTPSRRLAIELSADLAIEVQLGLAVEWLGVDGRAREQRALGGPARESRQEDTWRPTNATRLMNCDAMDPSSATQDPRRDPPGRHLCAGFG